MAKKRKVGKKLIALISTIAFLLVGTIAFFIGAVLLEWDIWGWFTTPQAYLIYGLLGVMVLLGVSFYIKWKLIKGDEDE